jgi:cyclic pyranopterin phosphate synthase
MIDLILGYPCNSRCVFCTATDDIRTCAMTTAGALEALDGAVLEHRPDKIRFGGGEPTVRKDLPALVRFSRDLGVLTVSMQTNGYMLSYWGYARRLADCGMTGVNVSLRALKAPLYERLTGVRGSMTMAVSGIKNAMEAGIPVELDVLVVKPVLGELGALTDHWLSRGVAGINFWFVSAEGRALGAASSLVPRMSDAAAALKAIFSSHPGAALKSFYIPYCFFPDHADMVWHPLHENTLVITPGDSFMLEKGRIDAGVRPRACRGCAREADCFGVRENYLRIFGDSEIRPL